MILPKGLYLCPIPSCRGNIIWKKAFDIAVTGHCNYCNAGFTLLVNELPKSKKAKTDG